MSKKIRTRIAPSPTGMIQVGNMRTALFNYLFSKKEGGDFILRVEDTDKERSKEEYYEEILKSFAWLGIPYDEGPDKGGPYEPYRQSQRTQLYKGYLEKLLKQKNAYYCFCSAEVLEVQRQHQASLGEAPRYIGTCRNLSQKEQGEKIAAGERGVIRFIVEHKTVTFSDLIRGEITFDTSLLGDIVIAKNLETPLYNFTVVVDDFEMHITHVIRGEDHIANTQKQILLQEALDLPSLQYAHVPLLLGEDRTKLSKRHGDTSVHTMREQGYLPEAIINFLALLGWNPGSEREIFSLEELANEFSLERIQKGGAIFNIQRLDWLNGHYIRQKPIAKLTTLCKPYLPKTDHTPEQLQSIVSLYHERLKKLSEITELTDYFFQEPLQYGAELLQWKTADMTDTKQNLEKVYELLGRVGESEWSKENIEETIMPEAEKLDPPAGGRGAMLWPMRVALSGKKASAGPFEIAEVLGKEKTLQRIQHAKAKL
jgi:nondiscriminating glutamyl-tRNA synthetase